MDSFIPGIGLAAPSSGYEAKTRPPLHPLATRALHWIGALAFVVAFAAVLAADAVDVPGAGRALATIHMSAGLTVLALSVARIGMRIFGSPLASHVLPVAIRRASSAMAALLYLLLLAVPMLGMLRTNAAGRSVGVPGLPPLPPILARDHDLAELLGAMHEAAAWILVAAVCLHVAAAVWHGFVRKDTVLAAMLGSRTGRRWKGAALRTIAIEGKRQT